MKHIFAAATIVGLSAGSALAGDATVLGDWLVKEGYANVRIDECGGKMWGIVAWEKVPGFDKENPDASKKDRPLLGTPVLMGLAPVKNQPGKWTGEIYNSQNGKLYSATIGLMDENSLELEGCLYPNFLCQSQKWTRVKSPPSAGGLPPVKSASASLAKASAPKGKSAQTAQSDVCVRVAAEISKPVSGTRR